MRLLIWRATIYVHCTRNAYANHSRSLALARTQFSRSRSLKRLNLSLAAAVMKSAPSEIHLLHFCAAVSLAPSLHVRQSVYIVLFCRPLERSKNPINIMWWHFYLNWYFIKADTIFYERSDVVRRYCNFVSRLCSLENERKKRRIY